MTPIVLHHGNVLLFTLPFFFCISRYKTLSVSSFRRVVSALMLLFSLFQVLFLCVHCHASCCHDILPDLIKRVFDSESLWTSALYLLSYQLTIDCSRILHFQQSLGSMTICQGIPSKFAVQFCFHLGFQNPHNCTSCFLAGPWIFNFHNDSVKSFTKCTCALLTTTVCESLCSTLVGIPSVFQLRCVKLHANCPILVSCTYKTASKS